MILLTLRRAAPEVAGADHCDLCGNAVGSGPKGHLVAGTPGTATDNRVLCRACTAAVVGLARAFGPGVALVVQPEDAGVANKLGLPDAARAPVPAEGPATAEGVRTGIAAEAHRLSRSADALRAQADRLASLERGGDA